MEKKILKKTKGRKRRRDINFTGRILFAEYTKFFARKNAIKFHKAA
jgi:hypothetical protein